MKTLKLKLICVDENKDINPDLLIDLSNVKEGLRYGFTLIKYSEEWNQKRKYSQVNIILNSVIDITGDDKFFVHISGVERYIQPDFTLFPV